MNIWNWCVLLFTVIWIAAILYAREKHCKDKRQEKEGCPDTEHPLGE